MVESLHAGFKVQDYTLWKKSYDEHVEARKASGEVSFRVFRDVDDPNTLTVLAVYESEEKARMFVESPKLKAAMDAAGVIEMGQLLFLQELDHGTH